jgi:hypothetical protein
MAKRRKSKKRLQVAAGAPGKLTALMVEERRKQFEAGHDWAPLDAADYCARAGMAMPVWLAQAFCDRYLDWHLFRAKSLDAAFGVKRKKGMHVDDQMHREWLKPRVVLEVLRIQRRKRVPFDEALFARVAKKYGIRKSLANEIYYDSKNQYRKLLEHIVTEETKLKDDAATKT